MIVHPNSSGESISPNAPISKKRKAAWQPQCEGILQSQKTEPKGPPSKQHRIQKQGQKILVAEKLLTSKDTATSQKTIEDAPMTDQEIESPPQTMENIRKKTITNLLQAIQDAAFSNDPLKEITPLLETSLVLSCDDGQLRPFLKDVRLLMKKYSTNTTAVKQLLFPLLERVFSEKILPLQGHEIAGQLLFISDCTETTSLTIETAHNIAKNLLLAKMAEYTQIIKEHKTIGIFEEDPPRPCSPLERKSSITKSFAKTGLKSG